MLKTDLVGRANLEGSAMRKVVFILFCLLLVACASGLERPKGVCSRPEDDL